MARSTPVLERRRPGGVLSVRGGRFMAAGHVIVVGLLCFGIWLLLDARQLYNAAQSSPLGTRRSVSITLMRPIARVEEALSLDRLVNGINRALGRDNLATPGSAASITTPTTLAPSVTTTPVTPTTIAHQHATSTTTKAHQALVGSIAKPSGAAPLRVLDIGDSIGEDLGTGLGDVLGSSRLVSLSLDSVGDTGLSNLAYYNWPAVLQKELTTTKPGLVVAMFGGNDWQAFLVNGSPVQPGTSVWLANYAARVGEMMAEVRASGAQMIWVGLPIFGPSSELPAQMAPTLNAIYQSQAIAHGVEYFSSYALFENAHGKYSQYLPDSTGNLVLMRDPDGIHIAPPAGDHLLATHVVAAIEKTWHLSL